MGAIRFDLLVEPESGDPYLVVADQRDVSRFEREDFYTNRKHTTLRYLAWAAAKRTGLIKIGFDQFDATTVEVGEAPKPAVDALDPGRPDPKTDSSSTSFGGPAAE